MTIIAFDPGITTGIAVYRPETRTIETHQISAGHHELWNFMARTQPTEIICESFVYQKRNKVELYPVEVIGVIKLYCETYELRLFMQSPSQAKGLFTNDKIRAMGLWKVNMRHAIDATRHLLYYLVVTRGDTSWLNTLNPDS